eukprot:34474-Chlamydomonas_euryale.AAC.2
MTACRSAKRHNMASSLARADSMRSRNGLSHALHLTTSMPASRRASSAREGGRVENLDKQARITGGETFHVLHFDACVTRVSSMHAR